MRAWPLLLLAVACTPTIQPGSYQCGPNAFCPDGLTCDGATYACVDEGVDQAFACTASNSTQPSATQLQLDSEQCGASLQGSSCLASHQTDSWFALKVGACNVTAKATITFPWAFESLGVKYFDGSGAPVGSDMDCTPANGTEPATCISASLASGSSYYVDIVPDGTDNCGGDCDYNSYLLQLELSTN